MYVSYSIFIFILKKGDDSRKVKDRRDVTDEIAVTRTELNDLAVRSGGRGSSKRSLLDVLMT